MCIFFLLFRLVFWRHLDPKSPPKPSRQFGYHEIGRFIKTFKEINNGLDHEAS